VKSKLISEAAEKTFVLVFDTGDDVLKQLQRFAEDERLGASRFSGIGAFSRVRLGFFQWETKDYKPISIDEQVEVLSFTGDITLENGKPIIHVHVVVGKSDGTAWGGHLLEGQVRPTLEIMIVEAPRYLQRRADSQTGLPLIRLDAA
jgi:uncharacterized protein